MIRDKRKFIDLYPVYLRPRVPVRVSVVPILQISVTELHPILAHLLPPPFEGEG